jgi:hypothetical protein
LPLLFLWDRLHWQRGGAGLPKTMSDKKKRPPRSSKDKPPRGMVVCSYKLGDLVIVVTQHLDARRQSA